MADTLRLQQSSLARRQLNPIIEEDSDDAQSPIATKGQQTRRADTSHLKIQAWLSPMSDHFPTPRGINYLSAPVLPSSPSASTASDNSPAASSNPWNRTSVGTDSTEFDDLYDVTDDEANDKTLRRRSSVRKSTSQSSAALKQSMRLVIPENRASEEQRSALDEFKKITSPVPLTPSAQLTMSPAQFHFIEKQQAHEVPTVSAPPSLDGSLSSEQLAAMSAPPTPVIGNDDDAPAEESWSGVQLQPGALATLHALSGEEENEDHHQHPEQVLEISQAEMAQPLPRRISEMRQQPLRLVTNFQGPATADVSFSPNPTRQSLADLTKLEIPSPGGFFAGLSPRTRSTWHMFNKPEAEEAMVPPTSTTAEQFYRCPWNVEAAPPVPERPSSAEDFYRSVSLQSAPVEQVVEVNVEDDVSDDMPTARPTLQQTDSDETIKAQAPSSPQAEDDVTEIVGDFAAHYANKQQKEAEGNLDRTQMWLMAQRAYLKVFDDENKENEDALATIDEAPEEESPKEAKVEPTQALAPRKKSVRFSEMNSTLAQPKRLPSMLTRQESAYYRAFQDYIVRTQRSDVFVHSLARFESLQAQRVSLREAHRNQLLGKYQLSVVPQSAKKRLSTNVARGDDTITDDLDKLRQEKEHEAAVQMALPTWNVAAMKFLNGGRLITAPVTKRLARSSTVNSSKNGTLRERARILDLGGQSTCDWAWHCAMQYPNTKVYTVTTKAIRQLSNSNIRGPPNHRQVAVERLTRLPFEENHFDLVYARELHSILKFVGENGEDEWESCLKECMRVLKPGGYIEFSLLDSELMNAGPLGLAKSVEFGFSLKTLGYDPSPSKMWLGRLARAGFQDTRRAWMCLPVGSKRNMYKLPTPPTSDNGSIKELPVMGSAENIASVCSIVGGWNWERWLLRCEMEKVSGELRLADTVTAGAAMEEAGKCLDGVASVMEEGRNCKAAFRMLNGYARKPLAGEGKETIQIALAE